MRKPPQLSLALESEHADSFVIEELTFNPYISTKLLPPFSKTELWIEIVIRREETKAGASPQALPVPGIAFRFDASGSGKQRPTIEIGRMSGAGLVDLNELLYAEMWYSFVLLDGRRDEFMSTGYKRSVRIAHPPSLMDGCLFAEDVSPDGLRTVISPRAVAEIAADTQQRAFMLRDYLRDYPFDTHWRTGEFRGADAQIPVFRSRNDLVIDSSPVEVHTSPLRSQFACRRLPWSEGRGKEYYSINYAGTCGIEFRAKDYLLTPRFLLGRGRTCAAVLARGESIRFWVKVDSSEGCHWHHDEPRLSVSFVFRSSSRIDAFNTFFRVPRGYLLLDNSYTQLKRYATPPRLFAIWDAFRQHECYGYSEKLDLDGSEFLLSCDFHNSRAQFNATVSIFGIGMLFSLLVSVWWDALKAYKAPVEAAAASASAGASSFVAGVAPLHLLQMTSLSILCLFVGGVIAYRGRRLSRLLLVIASAAPLAPAVVALDDGGTRWAIGASVASMLLMLCWPRFLGLLERLHRLAGARRSDVRHLWRFYVWATHR